MADIDSYNQIIMSTHHLPDYEIYENDLRQVLFSADDIDQRLHELAQQIVADYGPIITRENPLVLVGVLRGVVIFISDLLRILSIPVELHFLDPDTLSAHTRETGTIELNDRLGNAIENRHVLFVEDIIDAGLTANYLTRVLNLRQPASLEICTLLDKVSGRIIDLPIKYIAFELQDQFVVGYGLDYKEYYRNLPFIALLNPELMAIGK